MTLHPPSIPHASVHLTAESRGLADLVGVERDLASGFSGPRLRDFATGRYCARRCLSAFGMADVGIPRDAEGRPCWPEGVVGSISHSEGLVGAAAAPGHLLRGLGIDIERGQTLEAGLWDLLFTAGERVVLQSAADPAWTALTYFSWKEAFYKLQHPLTGRFLEFTDVCVTRRGDGMGIAMADPGREPGWLEGVRLGAQRMPGHVLTWAVLPR